KPQSHSYLCSWGFPPLPPSCNSNYLGYSILFSLIFLVLIGCKNYAFPLKAFVEVMYVRTAWDERQCADGYLL
ncbi:hypothetical protein EGD01_24010, partial [Salmonella enterica]|nr:hypothetical protein [Salmonella enterica]